MKGKVGDFRARCWAQVGCLADIWLKKKTWTEKNINLKRVASTEAGIGLYIEIRV